MSRIAPPFRGTVTADAFVVDVATIGEAEARRRVLAHWARGAELRALPGERWLLTLARPVTVRSEHAPGLPLVAAGGGLAPPGLDGVAGSVRVAERGDLVERPLASLPYVDPGAWVSLGRLAHHALVPVEPPPPVPRPVEPPPVPDPVDVRSLARVGEPGREAAALIRDAARRRRGRAARSGSGTPAFRGGLLARLALRTPIRRAVRRRHQRYLESLTQRLRAGEYDALRDAISLALGGSFLSLRLPGRQHSALTPSPTLSAGGGALPWGSSVETVLRDVYRDVARRLENEFRLDEAAFVLADLLDVPREAVALYERHLRFADAARLAEGRALDPATVVRLWWRAGNAARAVEVARARGAFPDAVRLLERDDMHDEARALRREWARTRQAAGDLQGAVEALWPDRESRRDALPYVQAGMALGGPRGAALFAFLLGIEVTAEARDSAIALVSARGHGTRPARDRFLDSLRTVDLADAAADREVCTAALRALVRAEPPPVWADSTGRDVVQTLRRRADPLLVEDLPRGLLATRAQPDPSLVRVAELRGDLPVWDAVPLAGALLVAHGEHGTRLLGLDGRVRVHWETPSHALAVADHGGHAVVATSLGPDTWDLHRLDLATRRMRPWFPLTGAALLGSYDGDLLPVLAKDGAIDFLDVAADRPRALWRELGDGSRALLVSRDASSMAALVLLAADEFQDAHTELWRWDLPSRSLRTRRPYVPDESLRDWVLTSQGFVAGVHDGEERVHVAWNDGCAPYEAGPAGTGVGLVASGAAAAVLVDDGNGVTVDVTAEAPGPPDVSLRFPEAGVTFRMHDGLAALWDGSGRIAVVEPATRRVVATLRSRV